MLRVLARSGNQFLPTVVLSVEYEEEGLRVVQVGLPGCRRVSLPCRQGCACAGNGTSAAGGVRHWCASLRIEKKTGQGRGSAVSMLMSA